MKIEAVETAIWLTEVAPQAGKEVVYAEGHHDNKMIAHGVFFCPTLHVFDQMAEQSGSQGTGPQPPSPMATRS